MVSTLRMATPDDLSKVTYEPLNKFPPGYSLLFGGGTCHFFYRLGPFDLSAKRIRAYSFGNGTPENVIPTRISCMDNQFNFVVLRLC